MSADLLRRAATKLREHAEACVIHGPWEYRHGRDDPDVFPWQVWAPTSRCNAGTGFAPGTAQYIALMHPPVALALAEWLDAVADAEEDILTGRPPDAEHWPHYRCARAILREQS